MSKLNSTKLNSTKLNSTKLNSTDRLTIDHTHNNITIQVHTHSLADMDNRTILEWTKTFIQNLIDAELCLEPAGDA